MCKIQNGKEGADVDIKVVYEMLSAAADYCGATELEKVGKAANDVGVSPMDSKE